MIPMPTKDSPVWNDSEPLECVAILPEAPGVKTFVFRAPSAAMFVYRAGQFLTLDLPVPGGNVQRTYTISSSPVTAAYVSITAKVQAGSIGTRWMHDHLQVGMRLRAHGPAGPVPSAPATGREIPVHLGGVRGYADDVDGHHAV
jgi:stachydrine N-demethylase, reductase component